MFAHMLRFEFRWQAKRLTFAAILVVLVGLALIMVRQGYGPAAAHINSPYSVMQSSALLSLWLLLTQTIFCVHGALRDDEHRMQELIGSRPIGAWRLMGSRVVGIVGSGVLVMTIVLVVQMVAPYLIATEPERVGPFRVMPYLWVLVTMVVPNVLLVSALLYAMAMFTRSTIATYVGAIAVFALYMVTALIIDSPLLSGSAPPTPEALARAAVLDPFGFSAFFEAGRYWTPAERNVRLIPLEGRFLLNRLLWLSVATAVLAVTYRFAPRLAVRSAPASPTRPRWAFWRQHESSATYAPTHAYAPVTPTTSSGRAFWSALYGGVRTECALLLGTWTVQALLALFVASVLIEALSEISSGEYATHLLPTSALMMKTLSEPLGILGSLSVIYFAADVMWRERQLRMDGIIDATPASNVSLYLAKLCALCAIPLAFTVAGLLTVLAVQLTRGNERVVAAAYLGQLWFVMVPMMLRVVVIVALQLLSPNRWIGLMSGLAFTLITMLNMLPALEHPMLRFGAVPDVPYSDLDGFGSVPQSFAALLAYWTSWAVLIATVSWGIWRRGLDQGVGARLSAIGRTWGGRGRAAAYAASTLVVAVGAPLLYRANITNKWESSSAQSQWRIDYERAYRRLQTAAMPSVVDVAMAVDLVPERRYATVRGTLTLENRTDRTIDSLWVATRREVRDASVQVGDARLVRFDERFGMWLFSLERPMLPGTSRSLSYQFAIDRGGIGVGDFDQDVAGNGSYLLSTTLTPSLGYRSGYEETNERLRQKAGLGEARAESTPVTASLTDSLTRLARRGGGATWFTLRLTVSTAPDQTVIGPGRLVREWRASGRRHFEYWSDVPMTPVFSLASARYAVRRATQDGVVVEVWYHPSHDRNVDGMLVAAQRTLQIMGKKFGPYRLPVLRMAEVPSGLRFAAFATSGAMYFREDRGMLTDERVGDVDLMSRRVAHEVAHQWWGHTVDPLNMPGGLLIVESLAKYSEQLVIASLYGEAAVAPILSFDHDRYLSGRARDVSTEPVMIAADDQLHLHYGKGALAFSALRGRLGDSTMTAVLAAFLAEEHGPRSAATAARLYQLLRGAAPSDEARALVDEWLNDRIMYDVAVDSAASRRVGAGYRLDAMIRMHRLSQRNGAEQVALADGQLVDVVVRGGVGDTTVLYAGQARATRGGIRLALDVAGAPAVVEVDPMVRWIDRDRSNNRRKVVASPR